MKLKDGRITLLFDNDGMKIELHDNDASITFADIRLDKEQTCQALSSLGYTQCDIKMGGLDKIGKKMEVDDLIFEMPKVNWSEENSVAKKIAVEKCLIGWEPDLSFSSQGSFFYKDDKYYAKTFIRRWV